MPRWFLFLNCKCGKVNQHTTSNYSPSCRLSASLARPSLAEERLREWRCVDELDSSWLDLSLSIRTCHSLICPALGNVMAVVYWRGWMALESKPRALLAVLPLLLSHRYPCLVAHPLSLTLSPPLLPISPLNVGFAIMFKQLVCLVVGTLAVGSQAFMAPSPLFKASSSAAARVYQPITTETGTSRCMSMHAFG